GGAFNEQLICNFQVVGGGLATVNSPLSNRPSISAHSAGIEVYPNPGGDWVQVNWLGSELALTNYTVYSLNGVKIQEGSLFTLNSDATATIDVSNFPSGIYFFHIRDSKNHLFTTKWIKQ
ncbi:MAG: T9SS type A sorting domain-containing protein, partial [Bacteroidota bacterium]